MATATRWYVDEDTEVTLDLDDMEIRVTQGGSTIYLCAAESAAELVDALIAAIIESGRDLPDLGRHGYKLGSDDE